MLSAMANSADPLLRRALQSEVHVWRWRGPRRDPRLDALLAAYLDVPADRLPWSVGAHGKPSLGADTITANWSHCAGELLLAVAEGTQIGVDLEFPRPLRRRQSLLERAFTANERAALAQADDAQVLMAWAHKEALVKAIGRGIEYGLKRVELDLTDCAAPRLHALSGPAAPASAWHVQALPQPDHALAAVAWAGVARVVRQFCLEGATSARVAASSMQRSAD